MTSPHNDTPILVPLLLGMIAGCLRQQDALTLDVTIPTDEHGNYLHHILVTGHQSGTRLRITVEQDFPPPVSYTADQLAEMSLDDYRRLCVSKAEQLRRIASRGQMDDQDVQVLYDAADALSPPTHRSPL